MVWLTFHSDMRAEARIGEMIEIQRETQVALTGPIRVTLRFLLRVASTVL